MAHMKKLTVIVTIAAVALLLGGCSTTNESGVEISKGWFAMAQ